MILQDMFSIYQGLTLPKDDKKDFVIPSFTRMDFINDFINQKAKEQSDIPQEESEENSEEVKSKSKSKTENKYSRMQNFISNKNPLNTVMQYFIDKGFAAHQAAGFVGNFLAESELNPNAINQSEKKKGYKGYGRGIAQWSNERVKEFENYIGKRIEDSSLKEQLDFVWYEVQQRPELLKQLLQAKNAREATDIIYRGYENGSATGLATPEQLTKSYGDSWKHLGLQPYNFDSELSKRQNKALIALENFLV